MKWIFFSLPIVLTFFYLNTVRAQLIGDSSENWKIIKTPHFDIIVTAKQHDLGLYYAQEAEKAYQNLSSVFTHMTEKTVIVVNDNTDISNGFATRIPYPYVMAYVVPVSEHDSLSEAGSWPRELVTHELAHILQFEPAEGFYSPLRYVLGTIVAPNMLLPNWWKEGMAVELETQFSPRGRSRSTYQDATIRTIVYDKKLAEYDLPQANEALPSWPYGSRPYIFGSLFFSHLVHETKNLKSLSYLADRHGERVPYFIEAPINELTQNNYEMVYLSALEKSKKIANTQIKQIKTIPLSNIQEINQQNVSSIQPRYSNKFKILAYIENNEDNTEITFQDGNGKKLDLKSTPSGKILDYDFHPTEKKIIYTKVDKLSSKKAWSDVYIYDLEKDKSDQITKAQRARNISLSSDGAQAVYVSTFSGQTQIRTLDLATKKTQFIINSGFNTRYETPIFWDNQKLLAVKISQDGLNQLVQIDLNTHVETNLNTPHQQIRFLRKINGLLYFTASDNGVYNLYKSSDLYNSVALTNLIGGIWSYDISLDNPNEAWGSLMTSEGFKVQKIQLSEQPTLAKINNPIKEQYVFTETQSNLKKISSSDYSAGEYLWPTYWIPFISTSSSSNGVFLQAQTSGGDPIHQHEYSLALGYDTYLNRAYFNGLYRNSVYSTPFSLSSVSNSIALGNINSVVETTRHAIALEPDMFSINKNLLLQFGLSLQNTDYTSDTQHWGPFAQLVYNDYSQNIFQISPETGWGGTLQVERNYKVKEEVAGTTQDYTQASFSLLGFSSVLLPKHHAMMGKISGLYSVENILSRYGSANTSAIEIQDEVYPRFVARGYNSWQFFGRSLYNINLEYRLPISTLERGSGSDAYYLKKITGAFVVDGIAVDGFGYTKDQTYTALSPSQGIWSAGFEFKLESTIGYVLPMNFILGYYYPFSPLYSPGGQLGLSLQIGGF